MGALCTYGPNIPHITISVSRDSKKFKVSSKFLILSKVRNASWSWCVTSVGSRSGGRCHRCVRSTSRGCCCRCCRCCCCTWTSNTQELFKQKKLSSRYNQKKLSTAEPHYGRALSKTSGVRLEQPEKKRFVSDLVKRFLQTVMSNRVLLKGDVVSARRACCAIPQIEPGRRLSRQWR